MVALSLAACTGDGSASAPASGSAAGDQDSGPSSPAAWCEAYAAIATNLGGLGPTAEDAASGVALLATFDQLWTTAGELQMVTQSEAAANRTAGRAYAEIMQMVADGASEEDVLAAQARFTTATEEMSADLTSSSARITEACQLGSPSESAAP